MSLAGAREAITSRLWPIPTTAVVVALVLGVALPEVDAAVDAGLSGRASGLLFGGDADAARSLLGVIASSLITVTALTFSLTVVTLQLASSQFSPRLLRTFTSDAFVQATLGVFLATFTYALTVLRAVRSPATRARARSSRRSPSPSPSSWPSSASSRSSCSWPTCPTRSAWRRC